MNAVPSNDVARVVSTRNSRIWLELAFTFVIVPIVLGVWVPPSLWMPSLWLIALAALWILSKDTTLQPLRLRGAVNWKDIKPVVRRVGMRFAISAVVLVTAMAIWAPTHLADPRALEAAQWIDLLILYPLLSVLAQEVLYRRCLFQRLRCLNVSDARIVWVSTLAFAAMHAIFRNEIAVALTLMGGWFFADTYRRSGSLSLVCLEHTLYGSFVFAIGLWPFFSHALV